MARADFLKKRADEFFQDAKIDFREERYNLAAFHLEQACQFYLKYYIFLKLGDFTKTHDLRELLDELGKSYGKEKEVEKLKAQKEIEIAQLNEAYITSRYLPIEFNKNQIKRLKLFTKELISFLKKL